MGSNASGGRGKSLPRVLLALLLAGGVGSLVFVSSCRRPESSSSARPDDSMSSHAVGMHGPRLFQDVTAVSGVNFTYRTGEELGYYAILESLGGGVALIDYDGDGLLDI